MKRALRLFLASSSALPLLPLSASADSICQTPSCAKNISRVFAIATNAIVTPNVTWDPSYPHAPAASYELQGQAVVRISITYEPTFRLHAVQIQSYGTVAYGHAFPGDGNVTTTVGVRLKSMTLAKRPSLTVESAFSLRPSEPHRTLAANTSVRFGFSFPKLRFSVHPYLSMAFGYDGRPSEQAGVSLAFHF